MGDLSGLAKETNKSSLPSLDTVCELKSSNARFRGSYEHSADDKGRVAVPAQFRQILGSDSLVVTNYICDGYRCLESYPLSVWNDLEKQLAKRSRFEPKLKTLENYYLSRAQVCALDNAGRINIAANLRNYAGLNKEITFTSTLYGFRIWDSRVWTIVFEQAEAQLLENPEMFLELDGVGS